MYLAELVEVAIGLVFVYLVLSMASSQIIDWISRMLQWRAKDLEAALRNMIVNPPEVPQAQGLLSWVKKTPVSHEAEVFVQNLYKHPLINSLPRTESKPTFIPPKTFSLALFDTIMTAGTKASLIQNELCQIRQGVQDLPKDLTDTLDRLIGAAELAAKTGTQEALDGLKKSVDALTRNYPEFSARLQIEPTGASATLEQLRRAVASSPNTPPDLARTLDTLVSGLALNVSKSEDKLATARTNVETWFNDSMGQLTQVYKQKAKWMGFGVGLVLALLLNIDTIQVATTLWREPSVRQALAAQAEKYQLKSSESVTPQQAIIGFQSEFASLGLPIGGWGTAPLAGKDKDGNPVMRGCGLITSNEGDLWGVPVPQGCLGLVQASISPGLIGPLGKLLGWLISAVAVAQGAQFWFDLLRKLVEVRGTPKQEDKPAAA